MFSHPVPRRRLGLISFAFISAAPNFRIVPSTVWTHRPHDGLPALVDMNVFYNHLLFAFASVAAQRTVMDCAAQNSQMACGQHAMSMRSAMLI